MEERVKLQLYTVGDGIRLREGWEDPLLKSKYHGNQDFGSRLPSPYKGRDEARASGHSNTIKDESKG